MSDRSPNERRGDDGPIGERLARTETTLKAVSDRVGQLGDRMHSVSTQQTTLVLLAEEAKDDRTSLIGEVKALGAKIEPIPIAQAQLAATIAGLVEGRARDQVEIRRAADAEQRCAEELAQIRVLTKDLPTIALQTAAFADMRVDLRAVIEDRNQRRGIADFAKRFAMIVGAAAALIAALGGIAGFLIWMIQNVKPALGP